MRLRPPPTGGSSDPRKGGREFPPRAAPWGRAVALATTAFAIVGFLVGLSITVSGGDAPDVIYHAVTLPLLIGGIVVLVRAVPARARER